jgi:hypothetical protein
MYLLDGTNPYCFIHRWFCILHVLNKGLIHYSLLGISANAIILICGNNKLVHLVLILILPCQCPLESLPFVLKTFLSRECNQFKELKSDFYF